MTKNPILNALAATAYISAVASLMYYGPKEVDQVDSVVVPIAMLSLFVLSAAVMGYLFVYQPVLLYFEGKKEEGVHFFLQTVGVFALVTAGVFCGLFFLAR